MDGIIEAGGACAGAGPSPLVARTHDRVHVLNYVAGCCLVLLIHMTICNRVRCGKTALRELFTGSWVDGMGFPALGRFRGSQI